MKYVGNNEAACKHCTQVTEKKAATTWGNWGGGIQREGSVYFNYHLKAEQQEMTNR